MVEKARSRVGVPERMERLPLTSYQKKIFAMIAGSWLFDSIDLAMLSFILGSIRSEFGLSSAQAGFLATASFIGMGVGAAVAGYLSDRFGRKTVMQNAILFYSLASVACGFAWNLESLCAFRFVLGFGMGMGFTSTMALVSEIIPSKDRGRYICILEGFWPLGFICAGILAYFVLPIGGWRLAFYVEAVPLLYYFVVRHYVSESPRWLEEHKRFEEADGVVRKFENEVQKALGGAELPEPKPSASVVTESAKRATVFDLWGRGYAKRTLMIWSLWFFVLMGFYGLTTWLGALLQQAGFEVTKSVFYTVLISLGGIPGFITASWMVESVGRKAANVVFPLGAAVGAYLYGTAGTETLLIIFGLVMQFFAFGMWSAMYAYTPELYPTRMRATGAGFASTAGRVGAILGTYVVGIIIPWAGMGGVFAMGAISFAIAAFAVITLGFETRGRTLEDIAH